MTVKITIEGDGLAFDREIDLFQATQIMGFIAKSQTLETYQQHGDRLVDASENGVPPVLVFDDNSKKYESPRQAIDELKAKTNPNKIVAIALYLGATSQNGRVLSHAEVVTEFAKAGEPTPKNITRDITGAVSDGYVYPESKTSFRLLSPADKLDEVGFKKSKKRPSSSTTKSGDKKNPLVVREEIESMVIQTTLDGMKDFFQLKERADKILWMLKYVKSNGVNELNRKEVFRLSSKLGGDVTSKNFTASNQPNIKNGHISQQNELISISAKGNIYIDKNLSSDE